MAVMLKCPDCEQKFRWTFSDESKWPSHCPLCGEYMGIDTPDDEIVMPAFISARTKANDKVYRDMESGSERRAELAAEAAGCSVADMAGLKITDMNDRRDCEIAAKEVSNSVTQFMDNNPQIGGFKGADGVGYSGAVQSGPLPNAGAKMRTFIQDHHAVISKGDAVSNRPGLETQAPNYRRRG